MMPEIGKDMLKIKEVDSIKVYSLSADTVDKYLRPYKHIKAIQKLIDFNKKETIYSKKEWLDLLYIAFYYNNIAGKGKNPTANQLIKLQFAYDKLLKLDGFIDLEERLSNGEINNTRFSHEGAVDSYYMKNHHRFGYKELLYRNMRIFINNFENWKRKPHKRLLKLYFEDGLTLEEIGKNHYKNKKGVKKSVSKVWIFLITAYYKDKLIKHMRNNPQLYDLELDTLTEDTLQSLYGCKELT